MHKTRISTALAFILASGLATPAWAQNLSSQILTFDAALQAAEDRTQAHVHHASEADAARDMAVAAGQLPDPVLRMSVDNLVTDGPSKWSFAQESMSMGTIGLMQTLTREDKRAARVERFEQEARLAESRVVMQLAELRRDTAHAWLARYFLEQKVALLRQQREESALLVEVTEAAYRSGNSLQTDVFMGRSELAMMDDRIREADVQLTNAITALARWIGASASAPLGPAPTIATTHLQAGNLEQALAQQPELAMAAQQEAVALAEVELAEQNKHEDWSVEFMFSQRDSAFGNMVSLGVSIPLQLGRANKQDRELAATLAMAEGAKSERTELLRAYVAQTQAWLDSWQSDLDRLDTYDATLIPLASERTQAALSAYQGNSAPLSTVLDARRAEIDIRLERLRIEAETAELWAQLEFLLPSGATHHESEN